MLLITPMMDYPELIKQICPFPDQSILLKKTASKKEQELFNSIKFKEETFRKFHFGMHLFSDTISNNQKLYVYYIPSDIYPYIYYQNQIVYSKIKIPNSIKGKFNDCKRYIEVDFNYLFIIERFNCLLGKNIKTGNPFNIRNPSIIIKQSKNDKISFKSTYKSILECPYIKNYEVSQEIKKSYIDNNICFG